MARSPSSQVRRLRCDARWRYRRASRQAEAPLTYALGSISARLSSGLTAIYSAMGSNIAVRLEGVADPGGILISEKVYSEVEAKLDVGFENRGEQQLKNIAK